MDLLLVIKNGHSADAVLIGNVVSYTQKDKNAYSITYKERGELFDINIKHVLKVREVV